MTNREAKRGAMTQSQHVRWNCSHYPGTRQLCSRCSAPTDRCEEDAIYLDDGTGPLCEDCYHSAEA